MTDRRPLFIMGAILVVVIIGGLAYKLVMSAGGTHTVAAQDATTTTTPPQTISSTQIDWRAQLNTVIAGENALFSSPDPNKVGTIMLPACTCYSDTQQRLTNLKNHNWHVAGDSQTVKRASFVNGTANELTLYVLPASAGNPTVDAQNNVVSRPATGQSLGMVYVLDKGSDGVWRIADRRLVAEQVPQ